MRLVLLLALVCTAAAAQPTVDPTRFDSLQTGNRWEFVLTNQTPSTPVVTEYVVAGGVVGR